MDNSLHRLAFALRWLAIFWPVGWAIYVTLWDDGRLSTVDATMASLVALLIPAALAFGLSWQLDRFPKPKSNIRGILSPR